ncbi:MULTISPECIES: restriction endonuclease subunit S [unclassified Streptomyces]|uniref:restriction endonuclease subunit S n=1 Tax=unclassified Streptomyces TaxID=2593676 RepID=UPI003424FF2C
MTETTSAFPTVPLGSLVDFLDHMRRPVKSGERAEGPYPYFGANGQQGTIDSFIFDEPLVLLAEDGGHFSTPERGIAYRISGKTWVNNHAHVLRPRAEVDVNFLCRVLENRDVTRFITGSTRAKLTKGGAARIPVPFPTITQQQHIAQVLDQVDVLRVKRREALAYLDELAQSIFLDMFGDPVENPSGWDRLPLAGLLDRIDSGKSPVCLDRPAVGEEWGVLKLGAVTRCVYRPAENKALPEGAGRGIENEVRVGDLLFSRKNTIELVGAVAYVRETRDRLLIPDLIFRLVPKRDARIDKVYLHGLLTYPSKRGKVRSLASGSAASMSNISKAKLLNLECEMPPLELQTEYASRVNKIETVKSSHLAHLAELDALFSSLQHRAFRGELCPSEVAAVG